MTLTPRRLFVAIFFIALFVMATREISDPDFGWHLRTGEFITQTRSIPHADIFSFTVSGHPWITHEWLAQTGMYLLYQFGGVAALVTFFALAATLTFVLVYARCEGQPFIAGFVVLFAAIVAAPFWGTRPHTLSLLLASAFLFVLDRYRRDGAGTFLLWLPALMLIWANSHGSFALGPALIAVYLVGSIAEKILGWGDGPARTWKEIAILLGVLGLCGIAIAVNPNGVTLYAYPFQTLSSRAIQTYIQEWQPPDFQTLAVQPFLWFLSATVGALALSRRRSALTETLLLVGLTYASLRASRQISIWVLVAAPILSASIADILESLSPKTNLALVANPSRRAQMLNWVALSIVALAALLRVVSVSANQPNAERQAYPADAVNFIVQKNLTGPIFNRYDWGGYLIWRLYPRERVFIDGRSDLYGLTEDFVVQEYLKAYTGARDWREPLERYHVRLVLVDPSSPLAARLGDDAEWSQVYADAQAVVFAKK